MDIKQYMCQYIREDIQNAIQHYHRRDNGGMTAGIPKFQRRELEYVKPLLDMSNDEIIEWIRNLQEEIVDGQRRLSPSVIEHLKRSIREIK